MSYQATKDIEEMYMNINKWKKAALKGYILYDSNDSTNWKKQNCGDSGKVSGCQGIYRGRGEQTEH